MSAIKKKIKVIIILGPTSSGKSDVAIKLAKKFKGEIISADSRQIYTSMNLGTGKVRGKWVNKVFISENIPHYLIDFKSPRGKYNISHFQKDCKKIIKKISAHNKLPIICGGTGFWISALVDDIILPQVKPDKKLRQQLNKKTTQQLYHQLKKLDSVRAKNIDRNNKIRLIRAIEICQTLGHVPKIKNHQSTVNPYQFLQIGINWPQEKLDQKIKKRLEGRWTDGMIKEVKLLKKKYKLSWQKIQSFGLAYYWIPLYLQNKLSLEELKEKVFIAERNYAKRQRTWFKRDKRIIWENKLSNIYRHTKDFLMSA